MTVVKHLHVRIFRQAAQRSLNLTVNLPILLSFNQNVSRGLTGLLHCTFLIHEDVPRLILTLGLYHEESQSTSRNNARDMT